MNQHFGNALLLHGQLNALTRRGASGLGPMPSFGLSLSLWCGGVKRNGRLE